MTESPTLAVRGFVATEPRHLVTQAGLAITSFRLVSTRRRFNRDTEEWEDAESSWFTVSAFRRLALSAADCLAKGDPVLVSGRLTIREWTGADRGVTAEIEADGIGHDLAWGRSAFTRVVVGTAAGAGAVLGVAAGTGTAAVSGAAAGTGAESGRRPGAEATSGAPGEPVDAVAAAADSG